MRRPRSRHQRKLTWLLAGGFAVAGALTLAPVARAQAPGGRGGPAEPQPDFSPKPPIRGVSPAEEQARFLLMPGYRLEPVLTDPAIEEPMQIAFDGNGRMFVLENRGYMQDADATGELDPVGRISVHEDVDNDGRYETHAIFIDALVFPRFVMPIGPGRVLSMESNTDDVYMWSDTDGDRVADRKELFTSNFGRAGNVEHQQSSLLWGMDNWMYSTYNQFRIRWTPGGVLREPTGTNSAQWGITQDSGGKIWFQGGASGLPGYFQYPVHYGNHYNNSARFEEGFEIPWGIAGVGDFQPGFSAVRLPDQGLNRVTGGAGNDVFRGDRLPADLIGDYIYGEPVARIVRRVQPLSDEGLPRLRQVYQWQHAEFIRSTDHLFRPVDMATAPDGTLYIVDTYRGIIQEGNWTRPGSYLRRKIDQYQLDKNVRRGRIWRLTYDGIERDRTPPRMHDESAAQLVSRLGHPNGWWRDTAQQLLILRQDRSVVPALQQMARATTNTFGRFHALWTLEGLGALDATLVRDLMTDRDAAVRIQAIRASETLYKQGERTLGGDYRALTSDPDPDVVIQAMLTLKLFKVPDLSAVIRSAQAANPARGVRVIGDEILAPPNAGRGGPAGAALPPAEVALLERGEGIYRELCFSCHGETGIGAQKEGAPAGVIMAPALASAPRVNGHRDYVIRTLLHGLTGPLGGETYAEVMVPMGSNTDEWIAAIASYVRRSFGNSATIVTPADVARVRAATGARTSMWTLPELEATLPVLLTTTESWKATASHNATMASYGLNFVGWSSEAPQQPGMWFQVELPSPALVTEIQFESTATGRGGTPTGAFRGGGGGGAGAAPPPPGSGAARGYRVQVSTDGTTWSAPVAEGVGALTNQIAFTPVRAKFIRVMQTGSDPHYPWSVQRLRVYAPGPGLAP